MAKKDLIAKLADKVKNRMEKQAKDVSQQLKPVFHAGDAQSITRSEWYQMIRDNWADPEWRQRQGIQRDYVTLVQDALQAHGLSSSLLNQNKEVLKLGLSQWKVDANDEYNKFMMQFGGPIPPVPIPPTPKSTPAEAIPPPPPQPVPVVPVQPQMPIAPPMDQPQQPPLPQPLQPSLTLPPTGP